VSHTLPRSAAHARGSDAEIEWLSRRLADLERGDESACERLLARVCRERLAVLRDADAAHD
jgi:hypothetical protein